MTNSVNFPICKVYSFMNDSQDPNQAAAINPKDQLDTSNLALVTAFLNSNVNLENLINPPANELNREKERIAGRLQGFNPKDNPAWHQITQRFGANIKQPELLSIAEVLAQNAGIKLDRDAKRRKTVLIKWFSENWDRVVPYLDYVVLEDANPGMAGK